MHSQLEVSGLVKRFNDTLAVNGVTFSVNKGECLVLLGPSGCGKTTTLRLIAGFLYPDAGSISINQQLVASSDKSVPPEKRSMSMVFQSYAVWPHKTVFHNVAYGLQLRRLPKTEIRQRVTSILETVRLEGLENRYPGELSGGQQQRVALARALVVEPEILLFDEPLSNLDAVLREEMRFELKDLQTRLGITSVYVTHDQREAMVLADKLIVMEAGRIAQQGTAEEVYLYPKSRFVASFLGTTNFLTGRVLDTNGTTVRVRMSDEETITATVGKSVSVEKDKEVAISVRPTHFSFGGGDNAGVNCLQGVVGGRVFLGENWEYTFLWRGQEIKLKAPLNERYAPGDEVKLYFESKKAVCLT